MRRRGKPPTWLPRQKLAEERKAERSQPPSQKRISLQRGASQQRQFVQQRSLSATAVAAMVAIAAAAAIAAATAIPAASATAVFTDGRYCGVGRLAVISKSLLNVSR